MICFILVHGRNHKYLHATYHIRTISDWSLAHTDLVWSFFIMKRANQTFSTRQKSRSPTHTSARRSMVWKHHCLYRETAGLDCPFGRRSREHSRKERLTMLICPRERDSRAVKLEGVSIFSSCGGTSERPPSDTKMPRWLRRRSPGCTLSSGCESSRRFDALSFFSLSSFSAKSAVRR